MTAAEQEAALAYFAEHGWPGHLIPSCWPGLEPEPSWQDGEEAEAELIAEFAAFVAGDTPLLGESEVARCYWDGLALPVWATLAAYRASGGIGVLIGDWNAPLGLWLAGTDRFVAEDETTAEKLMDALRRAGVLTATIVTAPA